MIGIEACDRESNTYLWHINALIHASSDLEHLILGLEIMFDRYLKSKKMNEIDNSIEDSINTSMENMNKMAKICTVNEMSRRNKMDSDGDSIEDESYFVQLKSRSGSGSPNKSQKKWMHGDNTNNNKNNNKIEKHCVIEQCYDATKIMENMISIGNNTKTGKTNNIKTGKMGMGKQIIGEQENEESNEIRKNDSNFLSVRVSSTSNTLNTATAASAASSEKENDKSCVDYIAQLLLSPDGGRKKHINTIKGQSSPNARRMKRIKRIRQQQRSYQHSYQRDYEHNYQHSYPENLVSIDEMNGLNDDSHDHNDKVEMNDRNDANGKTTTGARQLSPFEIGKFVRQVDKLQN